MIQINFLKIRNFCTDILEKIDEAAGKNKNVKNEKDATEMRNSVRKIPKPRASQEKKDNSSFTKYQENPKNDRKSPSSPKRKNEVNDMDDYDTNHLLINTNKSIESPETGVKKKSVYKKKN